MFLRTYFYALLIAVLLSSSALAVPVERTQELAIRHTNKTTPAVLSEVVPRSFPRGKGPGELEETGKFERRDTRKAAAAPIAAPIAKPVVKAKTPAKPKVSVKAKSPLKAKGKTEVPPAKAKVASAKGQTGPAKVNSAPAKTKAAPARASAVPAKAKATPVKSKAAPPKASAKAKSPSAKTATAGTCALSPSPAKKPTTTAGKVALAIRSFFGIEDKHVLLPRAQQLKKGDKITINGFTATLGEQFSGADAGSGDTATFAVTWREGVAAIAKQQTTISTKQFKEEVEHTKSASDAQDNGLFIDNGCFDGAEWMIVKKLQGQDILKRLLATKPDKATCIENLKTAAETASAAQGNLATEAGLIQADENQENFLFNSDFTHVDIIDFGVVRTVPKTSGAQVAASQLKAMQAEGGPFDSSEGSFVLQLLQHNGACK